MLESEEFSRSSERGHDLIENQKSADLVTALAKLCEKVFRRDANSGFGLHGFDEYPGRPLINLLQCGFIIPRDLFDVL